MKRLAISALLALAASTVSASDNFDFTAHRVEAVYEGKLRLPDFNGERDEQPTAFGVDGIAIALSFRTSALPASA